MSTVAARDTTFGFTDIAGSTEILRRLGESAYDALLERHRELIRNALRAAGGTEIKTEGDGFFVTFDRADAAVRFAVGAQRALNAEAWPVPVRVRMGFHRGPAMVRADGDYSSLAAHQAARVSAAAHGGQALVTAAVVRDVDPPAETRFVHLGPHRLRDFDGGVELLQLAAPGMPDGFPPVRATREDHGLPLPRSSLVGRDIELRTVRELLTSNPIVTLHGPGGVGKTRLALEAAASMAASFPDGLHLVELSPITDPSLVASTVATAVGVRPLAGQDVLDVLVRHLAEGQRLLILDSAERVLDPVAELVERIGRSCGGCTVLVTTTEPVRTHDERVLPVAPLPTPAEGDTAAVALESDAVRLLLQRATMRGADLGAGAAVAGDLASIARRLDGIPLALELAAGRIAEQGVEATLEGLDHRFELLTNGWRTSLPRHRTLEAMVEWTVAALTSSERELLRRIATLRGRWRPADAVEVCGGERVAEAADLQRLLDRSLLWLDDDQPPRVRIFDTVRAYVEGRVEGPPTDEVLHRKRRWLVEHVRDLSRAPDDEIQGEIDRLIPDLREAMTSTAGDEPADAAVAADVAAVTSPWFEARGLWHEAIERLQVAVEHAPPGRERCFALSALAQQHALLGDVGTAAEMARTLLDDPAAEPNTRAHAILLVTPPIAPKPEGDDPLEEALRLAGVPSSSLALTVRSRFGLRALAQGDAETAVAVLREVIEAGKAHGRTIVWVQSLCNLGAALLRVGRLDEAEAALAEARSMAVTEHMPQVRAVCLTGLSTIALLRGDGTGALAHAEERLAVAKAMGDLLGEATALVAVANGALALGDRARAREANALAHAGFHKLGMVEGSATSLFNLALLADGDGPDTADEAGRAAHELITMVAPVGNPMLQAFGLFAVAGIAAGRGLVDGATLLGAVDAHCPESTALDPSDLEWIASAEAALRSAVGDVEVDEARARGAEHSLADALTLATKVAADL